jgi:hypothetical protein
MRDPWIDPETDDIVRGRTGTVRTVIEVLWKECPNPKVVFWHDRNGAARQRKTAWIDDWRAWCKRNGIREGEE